MDSPWRVPALAADRWIRVRIFSRARPWCVRLLEGLAIALGRAQELTSELKPRSRLNECENLEFVSRAKIVPKRLREDNCRNIPISLIMRWGT
jgi:hypothetical protein